MTKPRRNPGLEPASRAIHATTPCPPLVVLSTLKRMTEQDPSPPRAAAIETSLRSPAQRFRTFAGILVNTALANITTSYLRFA